MAKKKQYVTPKACYEKAAVRRETEFERMNRYSAGLMRVHDTARMYGIPVSLRGLNLTYTPGVTRWD